MDADSFFPSNWLKADDVGDRRIKATITAVTEETVGANKERKLAVEFEGFDKALILNRTNYEKIKKAWGSETGDWIKKKIVMYTVRVSYKNEEVDAIRIETVAEPSE